MFMFFSLNSQASTIDVVIIDDLGNNHSKIVKSILSENNILELDAKNYIDSLKETIKIKPAVLNLSLGGLEEVPEEYYLLKQISDQGTIIVVASGNDNNFISQKNPIYPCIYKIANLFCIGSSMNFKKSSLSNFGPTVQYFIDGSFKNQNMTSFAAPRFSKLVLRMLKNKIDLNVLKHISVETLIDNKIANIVQPNKIENFIYYSKKIN